MTVFLPSTLPTQRPTPSSNFSPLTKLRNIEFQYNKYYLDTCAELSNPWEPFFKATKYS